MVKKILNKCVEIVSFLEEKTPLSINSWLVSFFAIIATRAVLEEVAVGVSARPFDEFLSSLIHGTILFFLFSYIVLLIFLKLLLKLEISRLAKILLWGQWLIIFPPIIDKLIFGDKLYWSFYLFDGFWGIVKNFFLFFGSNFSMGITWGPRFLVLASSLLLGFYIYLKKRKIGWFFVGSFMVYLILFLLGVFPSLIAFFVLPFEGISLFEIQSHHIAKLFLTEYSVFGLESSGMKTPLQYKLALFYNFLIFAGLVWLQFLKSKNQLLAIFKNIRFPQMFFNGGLFFVGVGLGWYYFPKNFSLDLFSFFVLVNALLAVFYSWTHSVFINDLIDLETDKVTNSSRPLVRGDFSKDEFLAYGWIFAGLALLSAIVTSSKMFWFVLAYLLITWVYSCHPFRLKRFPFVAGALSSFVSLFFLICGFLLISNGQTLSMFPWEMGFFLFVVYALLIPIKDFKDIEGDKLMGVYTFPVLLGEEKGRLFLGSLLFLSYFASVYVLGEKTLFFHAFLFGAISFWVVVNKKNSPRVLPWWVLGIVFIYGALLVMKVFLG